MERSGMFSATYTSLSTVTKRDLKTKTTNKHRTPPLQIANVVCRVSRIYS